MMGTRAIGLTAGVICTPMAGLALTPLPPCDGVESAMIVTQLERFADSSKGAITIEGYSTAHEADADGVFRPVKAPVEALNDFRGVRLVDCATRKILAIRTDSRADQVDAALKATEFLRGDVQAERKIAFNKVRRAAKALYGSDVIELRETAQTCGCGVMQQ